MQSMTQQFRNWLREQDPAQQYTYGDCLRCAFAQFLRAAGIPFLAVGSEYWIDADHNRRGISSGLADALSEYVPGQPNGGHTFGALADRLANIPARSGDK